MADKRLYTVTIETEIVVLAEDESDAQEAARDALRDGDLDLESGPAVEMRYLPAGWDLKAIPFGEGDESDPDRTIGKWIELGAAPTYVARMTQALRLFGVLLALEHEAKKAQATPGEPEKP